MAGGKMAGFGRGLILAVVVVAVVGTVVMRERNVQTDTREQVAAQTQKALPRLLDLGADKCIPCKAMVPVLAELESGLAGQLTVEFLDVWRHPDQAKAYDFKLIPTQIFFDAQGKEVFRHEGFFGRDDILAAWQKLGYRFELPTRAAG